MFKITHDSLRYFTLAELWLMAAMNQREAERKIVEDDCCLGETDLVRRVFEGERYYGQRFKSEKENSGRKSISHLSDSSRAGKTRGNDSRHGRGCNHLCCGRGSCAPGNCFAGRLAHSDGNDP